MEDLEDIHPKELWVEKGLRDELGKPKSEVGPIQVPPLGDLV